MFKKLALCLALFGLASCHPNEPKTEQPKKLDVKPVSFDPRSYWTGKDSSVKYDEKTRSVMITGEINEGTYNQFIKIDPDDINVVIIASPGGVLGPAVEISKIIFNNKIDTMVPNHAMCYSACTIIFQSGKDRYAYSNAMLMYHSAKSVDDNEKLVPSPSGTAVYWAFLITYGMNSQFFDDMNLETDYYITPENSMDFNVVNKLISVDK